MTSHKPTKFWLAPMVLIGLFCSPLCPLPGAGETDSSAGSHDAERLNHRGVEHLNKKQYDEAIKLFREALQAQPDYIPALDNLGIERLGELRRFHKSQCVMQLLNFNRLVLP